MTTTFEYKNNIILPTAYFGPVEYFGYLNKVENAIIETKETWPKQTYRNRTVIVTDKGKQTLSVPVNKINGNHTKTEEITINYRERWHKKHWRAIESAYSNSPYFLYYSDEIKEILFSQEKNLVKLNTRLTKKICDFIGIEVKITFTEKFLKTYPESIPDLRYKISPKKEPAIETFPEYIQVFSDKQPFIPNASVLDLLFCLGPESKGYLDMLEIK